MGARVCVCVCVCVCVVGGGVLACVRFQVSVVFFFRVPHAKFIVTFMKRKTKSILFLSAPLTRLNPPIKEEPENDETFHFIHPLTCSVELHDSILLHNEID